jgi:hypothetical protein
MIFLLRFTCLPAHYVPVVSTTTFLVRWLIGNPKPSSPRAPQEPTTSEVTQWHEQFTRARERKITGNTALHQSAHHFRSKKTICMLMVRCQFHRLVMAICRQPNLHAEIQGLFGMATCSLQIHCSCFTSSYWLREREREVWEGEGGERVLAPMYNVFAGFCRSLWARKTENRTKRTGNRTELF